jgi:opacity protein-like surface antigen
MERSMRRLAYRYAEALKSGFIRLGAMVGLMLIAAVSAHAEPAVSSRTVCGLEASAGTGVSGDTVTRKSTLSTVDLSRVGLLGGLGVDCGLQFKKIIVGAMFRASLMTLSGDTVSHIVPSGAVAIKSDRLYEAAFRVGVRLHEQYTLYGLVGRSWMNLDLPMPGSGHMVNGLMLGGGLEAHVKGPWYVRTEYAWHNFVRQDVGACKIEPDLHVARFGAVVKFNDDSLMLRQVAH